MLLLLAVLNLSTRLLKRQTSICWVPETTCILDLHCDYYFFRRRPPQFSFQFKYFTYIYLPYWVTVFSFPNNSLSKRVTHHSRKLERNGRVQSQVRDFNRLAVYFLTAFYFLQWFDRSISGNRNATRNASK
jgi:hypothetical protein